MACDLTTRIFKLGHLPSVRMGVEFTLLEVDLLHRKFADSIHLPGMKSPNALCFVDSSMILQGASA